MTHPQALSPRCPRRSPNSAPPVSCLACPGCPSPRGAVRQLCAVLTLHPGSCMLCHSAVRELLQGWSGVGWRLVWSLHRELLGAYGHVSCLSVSPSVPGRPARDELSITDAWSFRGRRRTKLLAKTAFPWLLSGLSRAASFQGLASCLADCLLPAPLPLPALHKIMQG